MNVVPWPGALSTVKRFARTPDDALVLVARHGSAAAPEPAQG